MKEQLLNLQRQCDHLRSKLKGQLKQGLSGEETQKKLEHLDKLFGRLCLQHGFKLSKKGRLL